MNNEQHFLECEAREWLRRCQHKPARIKLKLQRLEQVRKRPQDKLRAVMLKIYQSRSKK